MANNYRQFSEEIKNTTKEEREWLEEVMSLEPEDGPLSDIDLADDEVDELLGSFETRHRESNTLIYAEEGGNPDLLGKIMFAFIKKFRPDYTFRLTWADTCSKMRTGEFSGGALVVDKNGWEAVSAYDLRDCSSQTLKKIHDLFKEDPK